MFEISFHHKQECDEQQKADKDTVTSFVMLPVKRFVFAVNEITCNHESDKKYCGENKLALCKHCGYFSGKGSQSLLKFGYFAAS
jgi:hypothetical protein